MLFIVALMFVATAIAKKIKYYYPYYYRGYGGYGGYGSYGGHGGYSVGYGGKY